MPPVTITAWHFPCSHWDVDTREHRNYREGNFKEGFSKHFHVTLSLKENKLFQIYDFHGSENSRTTLATVFYVVRVLLSVPALIFCTNSQDVNPKYDFLCLLQGLRGDPSLSDRNKTQRTGKTTGG
jgi:hypothetical protein